jgi:hypothetical protein
MGLGVFAGQPAHCAITRFPKDVLTPPNPSVPVCQGCPANETLEYDHCKVSPEVVDAKILAAAAKSMAQAGLIDDLQYLSRSRIYTYCGTKDTDHLGATQKAHDFFKLFVPASNLESNFTIPSGHCWPEDSGLNPCGTLTPWPSENCGYDGPGSALQHIYGDLQPPAKSIVKESLLSFDQAPFNGISPAITGLSPSGFIYVPQTCAET